MRGSPRITLRSIRATRRLVIRNEALDHTSDVVLAKARTHYPREEFGENQSFGTPANRNR